MPKMCVEPDLTLTRDDFDAMWGSASFSPILEKNTQELDVGVSALGPKNQPLKVEYVGFGMMYFRARYYSGELGRFVSRDPLGTALDVNWMNMLSILMAGLQYKDGMSLYMAYFAVNGVDPGGMRSCTMVALEISVLELAQAGARAAQLGAAVAATTTAAAAAAALLAWTVADKVADAAKVAYDTCMIILQGDPCHDCQLTKAAYEAASAAADAAYSTYTSALTASRNAIADLIAIEDDIAAWQEELDDLYAEDCTWP
ncbi:MAG: hypothetical protein HQL32_12090 [Planctomycetes bacterium]|nr:hypothetical protein [Planctomycetota bacterium]